MDITINNEQKIQVTLNPIDASGKPTTLASLPTWTIQSGDGTVDVAVDGLSAFLISGSKVGDTTLIIEAEGDPTPGVDHLSASITLHVTNPEATTLGLTIGTPVLK